MNIFFEKSFAPVGLLGAVAGAATLRHTIRNEQGSSVLAKNISRIALQILIAENYPLSISESLIFSMALGAMTVGELVTQQHHTNGLKPSFFLYGTQFISELVTQAADIAIFAAGFFSLFSNASIYSRAICITGVSLLLVGKALAALEAAQKLSGAMSFFSSTCPGYLVDELALARQREKRVYVPSRQTERLREAVLNVAASGNLGFEENNVLLVGSPGSGKTAFVQYLASQIANREVLSEEHCAFFSTTSLSIVSGGRYVGDIEERIKNIFNFLESEARQGKKVFLFIDEIHQLITSGAGRNNPSGLAEKMLTQVTNPNIVIIGATTFQNYRELQSNLPFLQRFSEVNLLPPTKEQQQAILLGMQKAMKERHGVEFTAGNVQKITRYCEVTRATSSRERNRMLMMAATRLEGSSIDDFLIAQLENWFAGILVRRCAEEDVNKKLESYRKVAGDDFTATAQYVERELSSLLRRE